MGFLNPSPLGWGSTPSQPQPAPPPPTSSHRRCSTWLLCETGKNKELILSRSLPILSVKVINPHAPLRTSCGDLISRPARLPTHRVNHVSPSHPAWFWRALMGTVLRPGEGVVHWFNPCNTIFYIQLIKWDHSVHPCGGFSPWAALHTASLRRKR